MGILLQLSHRSGLKGGETRGLTSSPPMKTRSHFGYVADITFYSLRRRSANDLAAVVGPDEARAIMNHDPEQVAKWFGVTVDRFAAGNALCYHQVLLRDCGENLDVNCQTQLPIRT